MVAQHLSDLTIEHYRQRLLPPAELLAANDHLAICEACYQRFSEDDQLEATCAFVRTNLQEAAGKAIDHPVYEQMAAFVDQAMSREEAGQMEAHLEGCHLCAVEVSDLRALQSTLHADETPLPKMPPLRWPRLSAFWSIPAYRIGFQLASTIAIAVLAVWIATIPLRARVADLQGQLAEFRQANEQLQREQETAKLAIVKLEADLAHYPPSEAGSSQHILYALNDGGGQVTLDKQGNLGGLNELSPSYQEMVKTALTTERLASSPMVAKLIGQSKRLMGDAGAGAAFTLLSPIGTVVQTDVPTFRWTALNGATGYIVTVYKPNSREVVATSPLLAGTEWRMAQPLNRGGVYAWQVRAMKDGEEIRMPAPAAPDAKFMVLAQARAEELERAQQMYANSHLLLSVLYAQEGLLDNAEQELQALSEANPHSRLAQNLWHSVKALRRR